MLLEFGTGQNGFLRRAAGLAAIATIAFSLLSAPVDAQTASQVRRLYTAEELAGRTPETPNPYLAFLPEGVEPDWDYWTSAFRIEAERRRQAPRPRADAIATESESNDFIETADTLPNLGTGAGQNNWVDFQGNAGVPSSLRTPEAAEDNGSILFATTVPLPNAQNLHVAQGQIGNGVYGSSGFGTGDYDFYRIPNVPAGHFLEAHVTASRLSDNATLDPLLVIYDSSGNIVDGIQDNLVGFVDDTLVFLDVDCTVRMEVPSTGDYYVAVSSDRDLPITEENPDIPPLIGNPFNSATGPGAVTEGPYVLYLRLFTPGTLKAEDNGSINLPTIVPQGGGVFTSEIGDGPQTTAGDFDFYALTNLKRGDMLVVDVDASIFGSTLDSFAAIWDSSGNLLAWNDNNPNDVFDVATDTELLRFGTLDSFVSCVLPANGTYYASIGSSQSGYPLDPFNPGSGSGAATTGFYDVAFRVQPNDPDVVRVDLERGAVLTAGLELAHPFALVELLDQNGRLITGTHDNLTFIFPDSSPLESLSRTALTHVATRNGPYYVRVSSPQFGNYTTDIRVARPALEFSEAPEPKQILFLDFDGAIIDKEVFDIGEGAAALSPLSPFLPLWGLEQTTDNLNAVIDAILSAVTESLRTDLASPDGKNLFFDIEIRNSRDHSEPAPEEVHASKVIIGGTIAEAGVSTIGLAESIDPGNFNTAESAFVLLDLLSEPAPSPNSINSVPIGPGLSKIDLIGITVGNIAAHEAGHFFGNFHTDNTVTAPNIMDTGGNLGNLMGIGPDGIYGTSDDIDVDFGVDQLDFLEGFMGFEDTLNTVAFGLPALPGSIIYVDFNAAKNGIGTFAFPFNKLKTGISSVPKNGTIRILPGKSKEVFLPSAPIRKPMTMENAIPINGIAVVGKQ